MNKRISQSSRAGLVFPVSRIKRYTKQKTKLRLSFCAPIYLAAVLEYLCAEILELAGIAAQQNKKHRITPRHIFVVIAMDEELRQLLKKVIIPQGGVLPHIHPDLLPKGKDEKLTRKEDVWKDYSFLHPSKSDDSKPKKKRAKISSVLKAKKSEAMPTASENETDSECLSFEEEVRDEEMQPVNQTISDVRTLWEEQMYLGPKLTLVEGNFSKISADAIINPTDADFMMDSFTGRMLVSSGGEELLMKLKQFKSSNGPLKPLDAAVFQSPNTLIKHIIHCFGPDSDDVDQTKKLDELMEKCLSIADEKFFKTLAIPILELSYLPDEQAAHIILKAITNYFLSVTCTSLVQLFLIVHDSCKCSSCLNMSSILKELHKE